MCGIFGFTGKPSPELLPKMGDLVRHRGPDDAGYWSDERVSLGMRRLSIVDLASGQQPAWNEDHTVGVVFNGEIYNHVELRADLEKKGHSFRSDHSDTETIPHLYEEYGPDFVKKLNGMFGIALWDKKKGELHLFRDHCGIKPLFFAETGGQLVFGSELKSILAHPSVKKEPDYEALHHYFSFKNTPAPRSAFAGIGQLRPGERVVFRPGSRAERHRWWRLRFQENPAVTEAEAAKKVRELLESAVWLQMQCDVPFGAYLSGGVDSSSVVALMSRISGQKVRTFTLAYEDDFKNKAADRHYAKLVADMYGTEHYEHVMNHREFPASIEKIIESFDEPFSGVTSTYFITELISKHVKVCLSGDGADELFASYQGPRMASALHYYPLFKDRLATLTEDERGLLEPYLKNLAPIEELCKRGDDEARRKMGQYVWDDEGKQKLYSDAMRARVAAAGMNTEGLIRDVLAAAGTEDPVNRALFLDFEMLLSDQVLPFVDRLSMAHSVEVRPPFLDYRLMEYAATLPGRMKFKNGRNKHILKEAMKGLLPDEVLDRPKEGFVLPVNDWLLSGLQPFVEEKLSASHLARHGIFRAEAVAQVLRDHYAKKANNANRIWNLVMFQVWWEKYFG